MDLIHASDCFDLVSCRRMNVSQYHFQPRIPEESSERDYIGARFALTCAERVPQIVDPEMLKIRAFYSRVVCVI